MASAASRSNLRPEAPGLQLYLQKRFDSADRIGRRPSDIVELRLERAFALRDFADRLDRRGRELGLGYGLARLEWRRREQRGHSAERILEVIRRRGGQVLHFSGGWLDVMHGETWGPVVCRIGEAERAKQIGRNGVPPGQRGSEVEQFAQRRNDRS